MIMKARVVLLLLMLCSSTWASENPYAGQEQRQVKALSAAEVNGLLNGKGMGMAKAAELNHYPGPLHVLEVVDEIGLDSTQRQQTRALYDEMKQQAVHIGRKIVTEEQQLDRLFASATVDEQTLKAQLHRIAQLRGELRYVHLRTHLKQKALMTVEQVRRYDHLRGYMNHHEGHAH